MRDNKTAAISIAFAWVPYMLVAWAYVALTAGRLKDFWIALGFLLAVRLFVAAIARCFPVGIQPPVKP
jgi:hypothetical protein